MYDYFFDAGKPSDPSKFTQLTSNAGYNFVDVHNSRNVDMDYSFESILKGADDRENFHVPDASASYQLPNEWTRQTDQNGRVYFYNSITGEYQWDSPPKVEKQMLYQLPPGWQQAMDQYGRTYYYNSITGEFQWDSPPKVEQKQMPYQLPPGWQQAIDQYGRTYYYNSVTGQCQWEPPC
eukprot:CAMPEP_0117794988 /NCGR_PEP_ID=MMETSP0948-20121206/11016_1 /TAXON_ID=44440 /ORGANISM="Chattonella subsalsa, Strain CCMP2191" /LENGTH=178 /DNA_ID=CAMNT_0005625809 /DNA_START=162 /DNA_END=698 /DNA_ORIENTATION=+